MQLTDTLSHNIISHKRDIGLLINQSPKQSANIEFKLCPPALTEQVVLAHSNSSVRILGQGQVYGGQSPVLPTHGQKAMNATDQLKAATQHAANASGVNEF